MDPEPEAFATGSGSFLKWDLRGEVAPMPGRLMEAGAAPQPHTTVAAAYMGRPWELGGIEELFQSYGVRYYTAAKIAELGFTVSTLLGMKDEELDEMMNSVSQLYRWELLVGERYGIKAAVRTERRRLEEDDSRCRHLVSGYAIDSLSQEEEQEKEVAGSGGGGTWEVVVVGGRKKQRRRKGQKKVVVEVDHGDELDGDGGHERQREHPFIVTEPGEVARGKKNGLDYLFHLYEQCRELLIQVQNIAKDRGEKCPTKVTNQVFRYAKKVGASYINKPKMRHYVHCYALQCLDEDTSNALRRSFKERGENVGAWRQACYKPLVAIAARQGWDIDAIFNAHPRLAIWYVPTKLRQLCHAERNGATAVPAVSSSVSARTDHVTF
ncbi:hypothetical protein V6N13_000208 [Hibiscus sabdariffa]|uniref:Floricaula/leafy-like transcription factor n=2 Tax=Hibiscus sabdariffa TaxID=183260 RepID=A0ABR2NF61_9ROSI